MTIKADTVIIGAGPAGLFQVFELGLLDIRAHLIDALPQPGGQCAELYPDKPIYDIPALPVCGAQELVDRLLKQIEPFDPTFHLGQEVNTLERREDGGFRLSTSTGAVFHTRTVIVAAGVGAFQPRRLKLEGVDDLEGKAVHYKVLDPALFTDKRIAVLGGGDSALDWALELHGAARHVTLIHRSATFRAAPASVAAFMKRVESGDARFVQGNVVDLVRAGDALEAVAVQGPDSGTQHVELDHLLVFYGLSPKLGPIEKWGLDRVKNQIVVDTEKFQTNIPGVFAIGDINTYPGKKKLILSGFHEAALVSFAVKQHLDPDARIQLQYTTTSTSLHKRLGLKPAV
jgi:thioredoxin reductase (NADPH)